jgi:hypothetical protein
MNDWTNETRASTAKIDLIADIKCQMNLPFNF